MMTKVLFSLWRLEPTSLARIPLIINVVIHSLNDLFRNIDKSLLMVVVVSTYYNL